jgi:DNA-directed RNA polymerase subunit RPC12/RpoP
MAEQIVRCPYCMLGDQGKPMLQRPTWYVCERCGRTVIPDDPGFKCSYRNCLRVKRAA